MTNKEYHNTQAIGKSMLFNMAKSPAYYKYKLENKEETDAMTFGSAFHKLVLEPNEFNEEYAVLSKIDKRTTIGKAQFAQFELDNLNKTIISYADFNIMQEMNYSLMQNKFAMELINNSKHETSHFWIDSKTGLNCKCRPDMDHLKSKLIIDLKTCNNADTDTFSRDCLKYGYHLQAAHYLDSFKNLSYQFMFLCIEKKPPYSINILIADEEFIAQGKILQEKLLKELKYCIDNNVFYGYNGKNNSPNTLSLPYWGIDEYE